MIASLLLLCWEIFQENISISSQKSVLCLSLWEWSFPRYTAHTRSTTVIFYNHGAYNLFDLESWLSSSFAFHLTSCICCFTILLWSGEDKSNAPLVMRASMFAILFEQITFCIIVISTEGLQYVKTSKTFPDFNTKWQESLANMENPWCDIAYWL